MEKSSLNTYIGVGLAGAALLLAKYLADQKNKKEIMQ